MEFDSGMHSFGLMVQIFFVDILLSGDNAIVIALACRNLPARQMRQAIMFGTASAVLLRIIFTSIVGFVLAIPFLKLFEDGFSFLYLQEHPAMPFRLLQ